MVDDIAPSEARLSQLMGLIGTTSTGTVRKPRANKYTYGVDQREFNIAERIKRAEQENIDQALDILRGFYTNAQWQFRLIINDEELISKLDRTTNQNLVFDRTMEAARTIFVPEVKLMLEAIFKIALEGVSDGAFPAEYRNKLKIALKQLPPAKVNGSRPQQAYVILPDLYLYLGDYNDYEKGFHDQAQLGTDELKFGKAYTNFVNFLGNTPRVKLPYGGEALKEPRAGIRYKAWKALYDGQTGYKIDAKTISYKQTRSKVTGRFLRKKAPVHVRAREIKFPDGASWNKTKSNRLRAWGSKAPFWLLLEYGQPKYEPKVVPNVINSIEISNKFRQRTTTTTGTITRQYAANGGINESGLDLTSIDASVESKVVSKSVLHVSGNRPANITLAWIQACNSRWVSVITRVWAEQIAAFNAGSLGVSRESVTAATTHGSSSGNYNYQSSSAAAGTVSGPSRGNPQEEFVREYANAVLLTEKEFEEKVNRIMSEYGFGV